MSFQELWAWNGSGHLAPVVMHLVRGPSRCISCLHSAVRWSPQLSECHQAQQLANSYLVPSGKGFWSQISLKTTCLCVPEVFVMISKGLSFTSLSIPLRVSSSPPLRKVTLLSLGTLSPTSAIQALVQRSLHPRKASPGTQLEETTPSSHYHPMPFIT